MDNRPLLILHENYGDRWEKVNIPSQKILCKISFI